MHVLQCRICCNDACVALAHVLHAQKTRIACANAPLHRCESDACVAMAHVLQWRKCCNGARVAMAHVLHGTENRFACANAPLQQMAPLDGKIMSERRSFVPKGR